MARPVELPYKRQDVMRAFAMFAEPTDQQGQINPENLERTLVRAHAAGAKSTCLSHALTLVEGTSRAMGC